MSDRYSIVFGKVAVFFHPISIGVFNYGDADAGVRFGACAAARAAESILNPGRRRCASPSGELALSPPRNHSLASVDSATESSSGK